MNIVERVNNRSITPRHNNYREVTIDAAGNGPVINFNGVHTRNSGLPGFSPIKQVSGQITTDAENRKGEKTSWWDAAKDWGHTALDVAGMVPVVGVFADGANALWYGAEGDYTNAALSALAAVPGIGQAATATKLAGKGASKYKKIKAYAAANKKMTALDAVIGADLAQHGVVDNMNKHHGGDMSVKVSPFVGAGEDYKMWDTGNEKIDSYAPRSVIRTTAEEGANLYSGSRLEGWVDDTFNSGGTSDNKKKDDKPVNTNTNVVTSVKSKRPQKYTDYWKNKAKEVK
jgi:hypothetical protein